MDIELYNQEKGSGEPLILLHGNGEDRTYFENQMEFFQNGYRVIALDTRGHGQSPRGTKPFTIEQFSCDLYDFMKSHPELELYDEYKDDGKSGSNFDRAEFQRMMKDIEAGKVNCVVVKDQSRFGRDYIDVGKYKEKIFPKLGVRFITINEGYDSLSATSSDDLAFTINSFVYDFYIRDISTKIRTNLTAKKQNGEYAGAFVAYGYSDADAAQKALTARDSQRCDVESSGGDPNHTGL